MERASSSFRSAASISIRAKAVEELTQALLLAPSPMTYGQRAQLQLKMKRPLAAINDCTVALNINPDSAKALKVRGKAYRFVGKWKESMADLSKAMSIDFDPAVLASESLDERVSAALPACGAVRPSTGGVG